jgi:hypothetical protein
MKTTTRTSRPKPMSDIAGEWHQTIRGDTGARARLLRRIMPTRGR